jgi:antitoxin HigA-1
MSASLLIKSKPQRKIRPSHPGAVLRQMLQDLEEDSKLGSGIRTISQTELAKRVGVSRKTINELINEKQSMTADMAIRLSRALGTTPEIWLNLQKAVDLWDAYQEHEKEYSKVKPLVK